MDSSARMHVCEQDIGCYIVIPCDVPWRKKRTIASSLVALHNQ